MIEIGGYLSLELNSKKEFFKESKDTIIYRLNSGRSAIVAALNNCDVENLYIPFYNCDSVEKALIKAGYNVLKYKIDNHFMPIIYQIGKKDWILYVDYFGICGKNKTLVKNKFHNVIFDNTQAFFAKPIIGDNVFNVYSCRKFFGVSDGAYLVYKRTMKKNFTFEQDFSWERCLFLIKSIEKGTNYAYEDSLRNEQEIGFDIKKMSPFTQKVLMSIDYKTVKSKRLSNYNYLVKRFKNVNELKLNARNNNPPMVYPLLVKNKELRQELINNHIYVPQWWKYLIESMGADDYESYLSSYLIPIPIDQRYSKKDMRLIVNIIKHFLKNSF